jgi:hypothetical protein
MKRRYSYPVWGILVVAGVIAVLLWKQQGSPTMTTDALAAGGVTSYPAAQFLQATDGGMAQYGYSMQQSSSPSQSLQAIADWNSYITSRSEWGLTTTLIDRLAVADWNARQAGSPTITAAQLATAATDLINAKLATMTTTQIEEGARQMYSEMTPKGRYGLNQRFPYASAQKVGGRWTVTIEPEAFSEKKTDFATWAPGMVSSSANFYPAEASLVAYAVASGDPGYGSEFLTDLRKDISDLTGLDMSQRALFGENGYGRRRPLNTFLTEPAMSQFFSALGF